jgi:hypothetical protein
VDDTCRAVAVAASWVPWLTHARTGDVKGADADMLNRLAKRTAREKVIKWSERCWLEMGVLTMTLFGYVTVRTLQHTERRLNSVVLSDYVCVYIVRS